MRISVYYNSTLNVPYVLPPPFICHKGPTVTRPPWSVIISLFCLRVSCALLLNGHSELTPASCILQPLIYGGRKSVEEWPKLGHSSKSVPYLPSPAGITPIPTFLLRIFTEELDVECTCYIAYNTTKAKRIEGMITVNYRPHTPMEQDILVGILLAMYMGNDNLSVKLVVHCGL